MSNTKRAELHPCPLCGNSSGYHLGNGSTHRWWEVRCKHCGECITECRSDQGTLLDASKPVTWPAADEAWNEAGKYAAGLKAENARLTAEVGRLNAWVAEYTKEMRAAFLAKDAELRRLAGVEACQSSLIDQLTERRAAYQDLLADHVALRADRDRLAAEVEALYALLPGVTYMDPPDGGDVERLEQMRRMAEDAARYRHMRNNARFRDHNGPALCWYLPRFWAGDSAERLDAAIDASRGKG